MKSTRDVIRDLLAAHGEASVASLAGELGLNQANIRRHLEVMRAEGLVDARIQRHEVGRPSHMYRLTERAEEMNAHYPRLINRMFRRLTALPEDAPGARSSLLAEVFEGVAEDIAGAYRPLVTGATIQQRVAETSEALKEEGIVDHWRKEDDGYHLMNTSCPYRRAAEASDVPCQADRKTVELLLGVPVLQVGRLVDGHTACEYVVQGERRHGAEEDDAKRKRTGRRGAAV